MVKNVTYIMFGFVPVQVCDFWREIRFSKMTNRVRAGFVCVGEMQITRANIYVVRGRHDAKCD